MTAAVLVAAPATASAEPADLAADYTSSGAHGYWDARFRGTAAVADNGTYHVSGHLEARCPDTVLSGFGRFRFRNQSTGSAWQTFDVACSSEGSTATMVEADGVGDPGDDLGIVVCVGGLLVYTQCGAEETVRLPE
jgi:hypothetical protein